MQSSSWSYIMKTLPLRDLTLMTFDSSRFSKCIFSCHRLFVISSRHYSLVIFYCPSFRMHTRHSSCTGCVSASNTIVFWIIMKHKNLRLVRLFCPHFVFISSAFFLSHTFFHFIRVLFVLCIAWCWCSMCRHRDHGHIRWSPDAVDWSKSIEKKMEAKKKHVTNSKQCNSLSTTYRSASGLNTKWCMVRSAMLLQSSTDCIIAPIPILFHLFCFIAARWEASLSTKFLKERNFSRKTNNAIA